MMSWRRADLHDIVRDFGGDQPVLPVLENYPYYKPAGRKSLLLGTRVRAPPDSLPLALHQVQSPYLPIVARPIEDYDPLPYIPTSKDCHNVIYQLSSSDIVNSVVSSSIRSMRYPRQINEAQEREEFRDSFIKELNATQGDDRPQVFNYDCWFKGKSDVPLHETFPARPTLNSDIASVFEDFRSSFADRTLLPRYSRRHMGVSTAKSVGFRSMTGIECERFYFEHGYHPEGPLEMRQTWKYNDLTPRTYFAQGGDLFSVSKYAQDIFNALIDSFEVSHRRRRFDLKRISFDDDDDIWIYDYSSFTSNHTEQKYFLRELADFCRGYPMYVMDSRTGFERLDLGQYIHDYNEACNVRPVFELGPALLSRLNIRPEKYVHRRAGALGVFGNLASCTVHHGLTSMNIFGGVKRSSVVGDDGFGAAKKDTMPLEEGEIPEPLSSPEMIRDALRLTGDIAARKFAVLGPPTEPYSSQWTYLKRALTRHDTELELWPQEHIINMSLYFQETSKTLRKAADDAESEITSFVTQVLNLLLRIHRQQASILDEELVVVCRILRVCYKNLMLNTRGSLIGQGLVWKKGQSTTRPKGSERFFINKIIPFIPVRDCAYQLRRDPIENLVHQHDFSEPLRSPVLMRRDTEPKLTFETGDVFEDVTRKGYSWLRDLGLLVSESVESEVFSDRESYLEHYAKFKDRQYDELKRYTVVSRIPDHLRMYFSH